MPRSEIGPSIHVLSSSDLDIQLCSSVTRPKTASLEIKGLKTPLVASHSARLQEGPGSDTTRGWSLKSNGIQAPSIATVTQLPRPQRLKALTAVAGGSSWGQYPYLHHHTATTWIGQIRVPATRQLASNPTAELFSGRNVNVHTECSQPGVSGSAERIES
jgi:hypothetical protein